VLGRSGTVSGPVPRGAIGVQGQATISNGIAVAGINAGNGTGVYGISNNAGNFIATGDGSGTGVHGKSGSGPGVWGQSVSSLGVRGTSTNFVGVVGISTNSHGLYGSTNNAGSAGLVGENTAGGLAGFFSGNVQVYGSFQVFGAKNAVIKMQDGSNAAVYCQESPEPYFEDFGRAQLAGGVANVALEREFASLIAGGDYMVFTHPEGDTRGLFISRRGPNGFEVREVQGGTSNVPFTYRVVTKRKDIEGKRFARVSDEGAKSVAAARAALGITAAPPIGMPLPNSPTLPAFVPPGAVPAPVPPVNPIVPNPPPGIGAQR
jgi:hypothetical protein